MKTFSQVNKIQLLYVENVISRKNKTVQQTLSFFMQLDNLGYNKQCDVVWAGEDGEWHRDREDRPQAAFRQSHASASQQALPAGDREE